MMGRTGMLVCVFLLAGAGWAGAQELCREDLNDSGAVEVGDAVRLVNIILADQCTPLPGGGGTGVLATGETTSYGPGSDGAEQRGVTRSYTDNGDGTITDNGTGLMWEKKSDDDSIHDWNNTYTWGDFSPPFTMNGTMVTEFLAGLNTPPCFAGHCDWRIPNMMELQSLVDWGRYDPAIDPVFATACAPGCTVTTCSCTQSSGYWSATTLQGGASVAWGVGFSVGYVGSFSKSGTGYVRAVRSGS